MNKAADSTGAPGVGVQLWPLATSAAVTTAPLPAQATAKAPPHPSPLPRERGRGSNPAGVGNDATTVDTPPQSSSLSPARGGEGRGEGAAEAGQPQTPAAAFEAGTASAQPASNPPPEKQTTIAQATAPSVGDGAGFGRPADSAGTVGSTVLALLLVVGVILLLAWLAKRMPGIAGASNPALKVVGSLALGPRERVVVVAVGDTQLLLSTGPGGTRTLHTLEQPLSVTSAPASPFAQVLAQQFGRKKS